MLILYVRCFVLKSVLVSLLCFACFVDCNFFLYLKIQIIFQVIAKIKWFLLLNIVHFAKIKWFLLLNIVLLYTELEQIVQDVFEICLY
jgi:hypothetical protein